MLNATVRGAPCVATAPPSFSLRKLACRSTHALTYEGEGEALCASVHQLPPSPAGSKQDVCGGGLRCISASPGPFPCW